jgi:hypothetical protein
MQQGSAMSEVPTSSDAPHSIEAAHFCRVRDGMLLGLVLVTIIRTGDANAGDQVTLPNHVSSHGNFQQTAPVAALLKPEGFKAPSIDADHPLFSNTDFTPRKHTLFDNDPALNAFDGAPMLSAVTPWERLSEYRSHDRVSVLTLWENSGSNFSLQAGRRGAPTLQWTSRLMNRGGATHGVLDRWLSASLARAKGGLHYFSQPTDSTSNPKSANGPAP